MCTHQKLIYPPHSKRPMYVKCGHCPACMQEKASLRVSRINNTRKDGFITLMVTLTYSRNKVPYIDRNEAYDFVNNKVQKLDVYRDCSVRKVRKPSNFDDYNQVYKFSYQRVVLDTIEHEILDISNPVSLLNTKDLKHEFNKIGVCYYPDYQNFLSRLRKNLKRHYNYENQFFVYACSEYGVKTLRPHFHLLIFIEKSAEKIFRAAIIESWPFSDLRRFPRAIEVGYKTASYVASYVNKPSSFPLFFKKFFKDKHSYSKGFGLNNKNFSVSEILSKLERGFIKMSIVKNVNGIPVVADVPIPAYVINRYFPKFKGYTTCSPSTLFSYMLRICRGDWETHFDMTDDPLNRSRVYCISDGLNYLADEDLRKIQVRLLNAFARYRENARDGDSLLLEDYLALHVRVWNCFNSSVLRLHLTNSEVPMLEKYDNLDEVLLSKKNFGFDKSLIHETDPNKFVSNRVSTARWTKCYHDTLKHRSVSNSVYLESADCEL